MKMTQLDRAIRSLEYQHARRRTLAITFIVSGLLMVASGWWAQHVASESISGALEAFYDTPIVAIGVVSAVNTSFTIGRLFVFGGFLLSVFGVIRLFIPDPKTTVLLALLEQANMEQTNEVDEKA